MPPDSAGAPRRSRLTALRVALGYAGLASLWILLSDRWVEHLMTDAEARVLAGIAKGWVFVAVTSLLLYVLVRRMAPAEPASGRPQRGERVLPALVAASIVLLTAAGLALALRQQHRSTEQTLRSIADLRSAQASAWAAVHLADGGRVREIQPSQLQTRLELLRAERGYAAAASGPRARRPTRRRTLPTCTPTSPACWGRSSTPKVCRTCCCWCRWRPARHLPAATRCCSWPPPTCRRWRWAG
ncbi:hypothetical protein [Rubrivivax gelatinosus]|uniref:hypothetical protein n=1 Tax=Rubrivivax gelatinosus TaxID=28068 RepID=UPI00031A49F5|nr:hypothetical protein [Rubrivivax gelatinosus]